MRDPAQLIYFGLGCFGLGASCVLFLISIFPSWSRPPAPRKRR